MPEHVATYDVGVVTSRSRGAVDRTRFGLLSLAPCYRERNEPTGGQVEHLVDGVALLEVLVFTDQTRRRAPSRRFIVARIAVHIE